MPQYRTSYFSFLFTFLTILFFGLYSSSAWAQNIKFKNLSVNDGLSVAYIQGILQDKKGFMWLATQDGLNRYDGYEVTVFRNNPRDSTSLSNNDVYALFEDTNEHLWIGTKGGGLEEYNPLTNKFIHHRNDEKNKYSISDNTVRCMLEGNDGILWVGTDNGLNAYDRKTKRFTRYTPNALSLHAIAGNQVYALAQTPDGILWIGTLDGGLCSFNRKNETFEHYPIPVSFRYNGKFLYLNDYRKRISSLYMYNDGSLLVGTDGGGLGIFDYNTKQFKNFIDFHQNNDEKKISSELNRIWSIDSDNKGALWLAAYGGGLIRFDVQTQAYSICLKKNNDPSSLSSNDVTAVYIDLQDNLWVGTQNGGVNIHFSSSIKFRHYENNPTLKTSLPNEKIFAIMQDRNGLVWIGTDEGGIITLDMKQEKVVERNDILKKITNKSILSIIQDKAGDIWIGTWGSGLLRYNPAKGKTQAYLDNNPKYATIVSLYEDSNNTIWIGTYEGGLFSLNRETNEVKKYDRSNGLPDDAVFAIMEDSGHNLWIGTEGGGVCKKQSGTQNDFALYSAKNNAKQLISSDKVFCIYEDKLQNIWIGTSNGLNCVNKKTGMIEVYYEADGLPNANIYGIIPDDRGNLWLTTNKGLSCFNPGIKNQDGSAFKNYDIKDGLQGMEFNQGAYYRGQNGLVFVGGENGLNVFHPDEIKDNPHIPPVYISSYKRFGKEVLLDTSIARKKYLELDYKDNFFSFDFVALDYLMPQKNKYSYMMEGVDEGWSVPGTFRHASYTSLEGGYYVFKVKAANSDGVWNNSPCEIHIRIRPPWWKTKWFYTLVILSVTGGIFAFTSYRTAAVKKENRSLEHKVTERTRELAQKNKDILSSITYAKRIQEAILPPLQLIYSRLPEAFILYKPKDIVSGDFYWFGEKNGLKIMAIVDCTGHGVPGAFMSMIGHNLLHQIIMENGVTDPGSVLNLLHTGVQAALKQGVNEINTADGMDVAICAINTDTFEIKYAGANRSLLLVNARQELDKIDGNKFPIGGAQLDTGRNFTTHIKTLDKGHSLYMFSDGYADQFGGENGKKFMVRRFYEFIVSIQANSMQQQKELLNNNMEKWKGNYEQVDDILVFGMRL